MITLNIVICLLAFFDIASSDAIRYGSRILLNARVNYQWGSRNNAEALIGLILANPNWYTPTNADAVASVQAMDLELLAVLAQDGQLSSEAWSRGKTAQYVTAIEATNRDPNSFYGYNMSEIVEKHMLDNSNYFQSNRFALSWTAIALCNINVDVDAVSMDTIVNHPGTYAFGVDEAAMVLMASVCLSKRQSSPQVEQAKVGAKQFIVNELKNNFDRYNEYSIGLSLQGLVASGSLENSLIAKCKMFLIKKIYNEGDTLMKFPMAASQVLPGLANKCFLDAKNIHSYETSNGEVITTSGKLFVEICITANSIVENMGSWKVYDYAGESLFGFMVKLNDSDSTFSFQTKSFSIGEFVTTINNLEADESLHQYWEIIQEGNGRLSKGVSSTFPSGGENYIFNLTSWV